MAAQPPAAHDPLATAPAPRTPAPPQDWPGLASDAAGAIQGWERRVEEKDRPAFERRYARALRKGEEGKAEELLVAFTQRLAREAGELLDELAEKAAKTLGMPGVPSDEHLLEMLEQAAETYSFEPTFDARPPARWLAKWAQRGAAKGATAAALFAPRHAAVQ